MSSHDTLVLIAEVAMAIAGFSGVVVALNNRAVKNWTPFQRHNLRVLLQVSALTIFFSIFPLIFQRVVDGPNSWNWALGVYAVVHTIDVSTFIRSLDKKLPTANRLLPYAGLSLAIVSILVASLAAPLVAEVLYLCNLVWHLGVAAMGFAFLVMSDPESGPPDNLSNTNAGDADVG
jgi:hypothetical protein